MTAQMRAALKARPEPGFEITHVDIPAVGPRDVLIKVRATSICGTDLHIYKWDPWAQGRVKPPIIQGHELCLSLIHI